MEYEGTNIPRTLYEGTNVLRAPPTFSETMFLPSLVTPMMPLVIINTVATIEVKREFCDWWKTIS